MAFSIPIVIKVFSRHCEISDLTEHQWNLLISQARKAMLLAELYYLAEQQQILKTIPITIYRHLKSAQVHSEKQQNDLACELFHLIKVSKNLGYRLVLLKGAAYSATGLKAARGRIFSDIDVLVSYEKITITEAELMLNGWASSKKDAYDQQYYRKWMHEIPAMQHMFRGSIIDLHHNILPRTVKACPNAKLLLANIVDIDGYKGLCVLDFVDQIIHSATHLFYDGELEHGCRDLIDLYNLLTQYLNNGNSINSLVERSNELGLQKPVFYALRYVYIILGFYVEADIFTKFNSNTPSKLIMPIMDFLFIRALMPDHISCNDSWTELARWVLYIRSHWLRMPIYQLIPHLFRKSYKRITSKEKY